MIDFFSPTFMVLLFGRLLQGAATGIALPLMFHIILTFAPQSTRRDDGCRYFDNGHCSSNWSHLWRHYDFTFYMESYLPVSCARFDSFFDYRLVCYSRDGSTKSGYLDWISVLGICLLFSGSLTFLSTLGTVSSWIALIIGGIGWFLFTIEVKSGASADPTVYSFK